MILSHHVSIFYVKKYIEQENNQCRTIDFKQNDPLSGHNYVPDYYYNQNKNVTYRLHHTKECKIKNKTNIY